jgi:hypothetical protein
MTSFDIVRLLEARHYKDIFVPECKNGPTWYGSHLRFDALAMNRSWANARVIIYEIKVSRSDFLADQKWTIYLEYCDEFYFVCPFAMIDPSEVGADAGLLWASKTGTKLFIKKKASPRIHQMTEWESMFRYILMSRARITDEFQKENKTEYWKRWLAETEEERELGWNVSKKIREELERRVKETANKNRHLSDENERLLEVKEAISKLGYTLADVPRWRIEETIERRIQEIKTGIPSNFRHWLEKTTTTLVNLAKSLEPPKTEDNLQNEPEAGK